MITPNDIPEVLTEGIGAVHQFKVKLDAKAFRDLYANRYSRKIEAIIRELSTNAFDSHVAANKREVPFEVHLPTTLEPYFEVRDYGTGMSHNDILKTYIVCFESNRSNSNDFTGGFGLGSKSPFAYTANFSLTSVYNGTSTVYSLFLNSEGIPCLSKMGSTKTNRENGVAVNFSVDVNDFERFKKDAVKVLSVFETRPIITGQVIEFQETNYKFKFNTVGLYNDRKSYNTMVSRVIMSNVAYPLEVKNLPVNIDQKSKKLVDWGVDIFAPNGSIQPTTSRESIEWTKHSIDNLKNLLEKAKKEIAEAFEKEASGCKTLWEARTKSYELHRKWGDICDCYVAFNGERISHIIHYDRTKYATLNKDGKLTYSGEIRELRQTAKSVKGYLTNQQIEANGSPIFINDANASLSRIAFYLDTHKITRYGYLLTDVPEQWLKDSGADEVAIRTSTLPKPPISHRTCNKSGLYGKSESGKIYEYNDRTSRCCRINWKAVEHKKIDNDLKVTRLYVELDRFKFKTNGIVKDYSREISKIKDNLEGLTGNKIIVYGIRVADVPKMTKKGNWKPLGDYVIECLDKYKHLGKSIRAINTKINSTYKQIREVANIHNKNFRNFVKVYDLILNKKNDKKNENFVFLSKYFRRHNNYTYKDYNYLMERLRIKVNNDFPEMSYDSDFNKIYIGYKTWNLHLKDNPMVF